MLADQQKALIFFSRSFTTEAHHKGFGFKTRHHSEQVIRRIGLEVLDQVQSVITDRFWFSDVPIESSLLDRFGFRANILQEGRDLRERILQAFNMLFARGYEQVLIVGNDTLISSAELNAAMSTPHDVLGSSSDGGFYLLKLTKGSENIGMLDPEHWNAGSPSTLGRDLVRLIPKPDFDTLQDVILGFPDPFFVRWIHQLFLTSLPVGKTLPIVPRSVYDDLYYYRPPPRFRFAV